MTENNLAVTAYPGRAQWVGAGAIVGLAFLLCLYFVLAFGGECSVLG